MSRPLRLGLIQMDARLGEVEANVERAVALARDACRQGARLVCLPELFSTGYHPGLLGERLYTLSEPLEGPTVTRLARVARTHQAYLVAPIATRGEQPGEIYDSAVVIGPDGAVLGAYHKTHLFNLERRYFQPGSDFPVFAADFGRFGIIICYDGGFPEPARLLALRGAELILAPSAFPRRDKYMWDIYWPARALENSLFVAALNRVGWEADLHLFGNNVVADPRGTLVAAAPEDQELALLVDVDLDEVQRTREAIHYLDDRRPELYAPLAGGA